MKRRYGDAKTRLTLSNKAEAFYAGTEPMSIYEIENDGEYAYTLKAFGDPESEPMTAEELIKTLEAMADEQEALADD